MSSPYCTLCSGKYEGNLLVTTTHELSGSTLLTDAPVDNQGRGSSFSPTDLVGVALGTCILTTMGIIAKRDEIDIDGSKFSVEKMMSDNQPRKITMLKVNFNLPISIPSDYRKKLEGCTHACPVHRALHPDIKIDFSFSYE
ncbi:MAG TPA: OsmC family protein [Oligoflexia bacterium]|nr:OsmC family protein [Oligoflexia bacterium]HMP47998.1 OsmC family protein [Oligoflexia bacterium]